MSGTTTSNASVTRRMASSPPGKEQANFAESVASKIRFYNCLDTFEQTFEDAESCLNRKRQSRAKIALLFQSETRFTRRALFAQPRGE
jgi:hypothetical protein